MSDIHITFKPRNISTQLIHTVSNERARDILERRYGLATKGRTETLESVGQSYQITRERVRQIENHAIHLIRESEEYRERTPLFQELQDTIETLGGVVPQDELLVSCTPVQKDQNSILFLLSIGDLFTCTKDGRDFVHHWYVDEGYAEKIKTSLQSLHGALDTQEVLPEEDIVELYKTQLTQNDISQEDIAILRRWLSLTKKIGQNPLGEWGRATSPSVHVKGMRDFAYLTLKRHGSPMHFSEVAKQIKELFNRDAHVATTHNELIKDPRFVLVGRGLYALAEWGYARGVVKDVIKELLREHGPLSRHDIIERVKRERYVKDNTIAVNLQDANVFEHLEDGSYGLLE